MASETFSLSALFNEIHLLSAELKKLSASRHEEQNVLLGARSLLQTLADDGPQTVPGIAEVRNTSRQNIQIMANRLEELGCIEFIPNPRHKRSELLRLTDKGHALLAASSEHETGLLNRVSTGLPEVEIQAALAFLNRLRSLLGEDNSTAARDSEPAFNSSDKRPSSQPQSPARISTARPARHSEPSPVDESLPVNLL